MKNMTTKAASPVNPGPRQIHTRPLCARVHNVREMILYRDHPNCRTMAEDLEVNVRTIMRDIAILRSFRVPIHYDASRKGYRYDPVKENIRGYRPLPEVAQMGGDGPNRPGDDLPESATLPQTIYYTLGRTGHWNLSIGTADNVSKTLMVGMLDVGLQIFEHLIARSVAILGNLRAERLRFTGRQPSSLLEEQVSALEQLSDELTPAIQERMPDYLEDRQLLGAEDRDLIRRLCELRAEASSGRSERLDLHRKPSLLPKFLPVLKQFCESKFLACVADLELNMKSVA